MTLLAMRLCYPLPDSEFLDILKRNMRPGLQNKIVGRNFQNIEQLVSFCVAVETTWVRNGRGNENFEVNAMFQNTNISNQSNNTGAQVPG